MWQKAVGRSNCFCSLDGLLVVSSGVLQMMTEQDHAELYEIRSKMPPVHTEWQAATLRTGKQIWVTILPTRPDVRLFVLEVLPVF